MADEDWNEYRRLVLAELHRLTERIEGLSTQIVTQMGAMQADIAVLKFKAGLWGAVAGAILSVAVAVIVSIVRVRPSGN